MNELASEAGRRQQQLADTHEVPASTTASVDDDRVEWIAPLSATGAEQDRAIRRLHELLLAAARHETYRRAAALGLAHGPQLDDLAEQSASDALVAVISRLDRFEGRSRFTTWAFKFAVHIAGVTVRRYAWRERRIAPSGDDALAQLHDATQDPARTVAERELLGQVVAAIGRLTQHQRDVLLAVTVEGVPIDVLAERLSTNRNALYKTLHDARTHLRRSVLAEEDAR